MAKINECTQDWCDVRPTTPSQSLLKCVMLLTLLTKSQIAKVFACQLQLQLQLHLKSCYPFWPGNWVILLGTLSQWGLMAKWVAGCVLNDLLNVFDFGQCQNAKGTHLDVSAAKENLRQAVVCLS